MKKWSKVLAIVLCIAMALTLCACGPKESNDNNENNNNDNQQNNTPATLTMGTGGESGTYYAFGGVLASYLGSETGLNVNVVSTGGTKANIVGINEGEFELATVQSDVATYAFEGSNGYDATDTFRVLGALYAETVQIVTVNPEIKSVADLAGKNVCVGDVGSGTYYNTIDVLAAYDMTIDDIKPVYQSFGDSTESLKDGKIDAAFLCAGAPTTAVVDLATSKDVYLISIDDEHMEKLLAACPWYAALTIPAGTYDGFDEDTNTITVKCTLVCSADLDDDTAYTIVSTIFDNAEAIAELHGKGEELDLTFATEGIAIPFSAGAARYYAEHDITVETA
ncbi:MAG: TAXI family TRAP transporter solute-binding subunit [Oscillospiraceae bacterium]|jgi:TRAP transporter TAXI family solute receptor|nr:TAXI family TRAP transporter solute-binding subunit [Oscillospiraceae bacterium]